MRKIRGNTVGTTISPEKLADKIGGGGDPTALNEHIANTENPHGVTIEQIGAAPSGYGLGDRSAATKAWGGIWQNGFFRESIGSPDGGAWYGIVCKNYSGIQAQIAFKGVSQGIPMVMAIRQNNKSSALDAFEPWEYVNPPMELEVEYRTTERFLGKPVYTKLTNIGTPAVGAEVSFREYNDSGEIILSPVCIGCSAWLWHKEDEYIVGDYPKIQFDNEVSVFFVEDYSWDVADACSLYVQMWYTK